VPRALDAGGGHRYQVTSSPRPDRGRARQSRVPMVQTGQSEGMRGKARRHEAMPGDTRRCQGDHALPRTAGDTGYARATGYTRYHHVLPR
jgi:hypothetical protein